MLATSGCPAEQIRVEYFLPGTEPHEYCPIHGGNGVERTFEKLWQGLKRVF
jgi:hypothetical protein